MHKKLKQKHFNLTYRLNFKPIIFFLLITLILSCNEKQEFIDDGFPFLLTNEVIVKDTSVIFSADILCSETEGNIKSYIFLCGTDSLLFINTFNFLFEGTIKDLSFSKELSNDLFQGKETFVRAFIQTDELNIYGNIVKFKTNID
jgi:hypothetical protein